MAWTPMTLVLSAVVTAMAFGACSGDDPGGDASEQEADPSVRLVVDLQDGFSGEQVELIVNGRAVAELDEVVTDELLGLAESIVVEVPVGSTDVVVRVDGEEVAAELDVDADRFLGVTRSAAGMQIAVASEPFGYG